MSITKKILRDRPIHNARGQYNYSGSINLGTKENVDSKFVDLDLYTLSSPSEVNEEILKNDYVFQSPSYFKINRLNIINRGVSYDLMDNDIRVAVVKGDVDNSSYSTLTSYINDSSKRIYRKTWGNKEEGWSPGTIIDGSKIVENFGITNVSASYVFEIPDANSSYDISSNFPLAFCDDTESGDDINIIIWMKANARRGGMGVRWTDKRKRRVEHYIISESIFTDCNSSLINREGLPDVIPLAYEVVRHGDGGSGGAETPAFEVGELEIEFVAPTEIGDVFAITPIDGATMPIEVSDNELFKLSSTSIPNTTWSTSLDSLSSVEDFRPISIVTAGGGDLQTHYGYGETVGVSSPIRIGLTFDMKKMKPLNISSGVELGELYPTGKFKFFVVDWNDRNNKIQSFDDIEDWPLDINSVLLKQKNDNTYKYANYLNPNNRETLYHFYQTPGIKNIKVVTFLYTDTTGDKIQAVRWKLVTTRINIGVDDVYIEDFSDLGGPDYTTIPWPYTCPVISGVSKDSQYYSSVDRILREGKFSDTDLLDSILLERTINNDELGDYIGRSDLGQVRVFSAPYDMNELLMHVPDSAYWSGGSFNVIANNYNILTTRLDISTLNANEIPKLENGKLNAQIRFFANVSSIDWVVTSVEITTGTNNDEGPSIPIGAADVNNGIGWRVGFNIIYKDISDVFYYAAGGGSSGQEYTDNYNFNRIQIYRTSDCSDGGASGTCLGSPSDTIAISNFNIIANNEDTFHPYWEKTYWNGTGNKFPAESSVGSIFISENVDSDLKSSCLFELNTGDIDRESIRDSAGNGIKGILIGDYRLKKPSKDTRMIRSAEMKLPLADTKDKAF